MQGLLLCDNTLETMVCISKGTLILFVDEGNLTYSLV